MNGIFIFRAFQPVKVPVANAFGISVFNLNYTFFLGYLADVPLMPVTVWMYSRYSTSGVLNSAMTVQLVGALLRMLTFYTDDVWLAMVGSLLCKCMFLFFVNI